jgi:ligand-binding sensor domain-containing protein/signal transduction histidine kinase
LRSLSISPDRGIRLLFVALLLSMTAYAVDPSRAMSQYVHDRWGPEQGFPRGPVYSITQSGDGYLWIGTEAGLVRFDGLTFRLITSEFIPVASVLGVTADNENNLWVRLPGPSLLRYRDGMFEGAMSKLGMPYSNVTVMSQTSEGHLMVARLEEGIVEHNQGKFRIIAASTSPARSPVLSLAQTKNGDIWMGTRDAGLFRSTGGRVVPVAAGLPDTKINCLEPDGDQGLWVGTDGGVVRWDGSALKPVKMPRSLNPFRALAMARDRDANIWVGTDTNGLLRINSGGVSALDDRGFGEAVTAVFEDREGNLWIGRDGSLERIRDSAFVSYSLAEGLPTDGSIPVFTDAENRVWFGSTDGGLWWTKGGRHDRVHGGGLDQDVVYSIAGGQDALWVGRQRGGLSQVRLDAGETFPVRTYTHTDGLASDSVYAVYQARNGAIWAGTISGGASKLENGKFTTYTVANGLASNTITSILETRDDAVWLATPAGLSTLAAPTPQFRTYTSNDGLPSSTINCLFEDAQGTLWVGTAGGLAFRSSGKFQSAAGASPALREQIFGIAEDRYGSLWLATSNRVLRVKRAKLLEGKLAEGDVREYGIGDGLRGKEGVKRHRSVVADSAGRIWFSLSHAISMVDPNRLTSGSAPAIAHVQGIIADGMPVDLENKAVVPGGSRRVTFAYTGLSLAFPEGVRFRYRLDHFDRDWSEPVSGREAVYTNLGPGLYRFRVIASNPDGVWSSAEDSLAFEIAPLFWQTWWFRAASVLALALAVALFYRFRLLRLTDKMNVRFEERLAERTRIAQELHDTLLQGFLSASMQLDVAADRLPPDSPVKPSLNRVLQLMSQVIEEGRNAVRGLRSAQSSSLDLEQAFSVVKQEYAESNDADFRVIVEGKPKPLHPLLRDEVYRIGREALVNALRHSSAKSIEMEMDYGSKQFRLLIRDNGHGIDPAVLESGREGHWGLRGMRERAERIGADFHVWSSAAAGTEIILTVPASIAFSVESKRKPLRWLAGAGAAKGRV